jgi:hypothetical protein
MKTLTKILAIALTLQAGVLFAGNKSEWVSALRENVSLKVEALAPVIPPIATFEEIALINIYKALAPCNPLAAGFDETEYNLNLVYDLAPVTPAVADYNDIPEFANPDYSYLAPTTPAVADFE